MKPPKIVAYLAHPVGPGHTLAELEARRENIANALAWLQYLVDATPWAISVPWLPYVQRLDESTYRERGIADDLAGLERCDLVILTGGRISQGMAAEANHARELEIPILDLTGLGFAPPVIGTLADVDARSLIRLKVGQINARPRRVAWLPTFDADALGELKGNRALCRGAGADVGALSRVIAAAEAIEP